MRPSQLCRTRWIDCPTQNQNNPAKLFGAAGALGKVYLKLGKAEQAREQFQKALDCSDDVLDVRVDSAVQYVDVRAAFNDFLVGRSAGRSVGRPAGLPASMHLLACAVSASDFQGWLA